MAFDDRYLGVARFGIGIVTIVLVAVFMHYLINFYVSGGKFLGLSEPKAKIEAINVTTIGNTLTPEILMEYLEIKKGESIFSGNKGCGLFSRGFVTRQRKILSMAPTLSALSVSRHFNGEVEIHSSERVPLARVGGNGGIPLALSSDGTVFVCRRSDIEYIVSIEGIPLKAVTPGRSITSFSMAVAALRFLERLSDGELPISVSAIASINVSSKDYIHLVFKDGRIAKLAWEYMISTDKEVGLAYMDAQVRGLADSMQDPRSRGFRKFDATIKGRCYALN